MNVNIVEQGTETLAEYATIPIAYRVESRLRVDLAQAGLGGLQLIEERVEPTYIKDYDAIDGEGPDEWAKQWDLSNWGILAAFADTQRIGGAVIAWDTPALHMLGGERDVAALWDIRVAAEYRHSGVGSQLFSRAAAWARERRCRGLSVETQNTKRAGVPVLRPVRVCPQCRQSSRISESSRRDPADLVARSLARLPLSCRSRRERLTRCGRTPKASTHVLLRRETRRSQVRDARGRQV